MEPSVCPYPVIIVSLIGRIGGWNSDLTPKEADFLGEKSVRIWNIILLMKCSLLPQIRGCSLGILINYFWFSNALINVCLSELMQR